jgi:hypothetical protein
MPEAGEQPRQPAKRQPLVVRIINPAAFQLLAVKRLFLGHLLTVV